MEQIISDTLDDILDDIIRKIRVKELRCKIRDNHNFMYNCEKMIKQLKNENKEIEKIIYKTCNHNWERDWDDLYSRYKVCTKCKLVNFPYTYN